MKKILFVLTSILLCAWYTTGFASDLKQSISKWDVTVSYYQEWIKDKEWNRINRKSGNEFLKNTKEWIQVKTKNKTTLFYAPFSRHNREVAKKAGDTNTIDNESNDLSMTIEMQWFLWFTEISPRWTYVTYQVWWFEQYDSKLFYMMDTDNWNNISSWTLWWCWMEEWSWQPSRERYFKVTNEYSRPDKGLKEITYTVKNEFPKEIKLVWSILGVKKIYFDKRYVYIEAYSDDICSKTTTKKFKLSNLK